MSTSDSIRSVADFRVRIAWSGDEDKPFPRALLVSPSQAAHVEERTFWTYAVIGREEFGRLLDVLDRDGRALDDGAYEGTERGYYVEVEAGGSVAHTLLGFSAATVRTLERLNDALGEAHRAPIRTILDRLATALPERPGP